METVLHTVFSFESVGSIHKGWFVLAILVSCFRIDRGEQEDVSFFSSINEQKAENVVYKPSSTLFYNVVETLEKAIVLHLFWTEGLTSF